jgi:pilus assembly protein CpaF
LAALAIASTSSLVMSTCRTSTRGTSPGYRRPLRGARSPLAHSQPLVDERVRRRHLEELASELRRRLIERRRAQAAGDGVLEPLAEAVRDLVAEDAAVLEASTRARLSELILREAVGLGPLEDLLADPAVEEVMVNGHDRVYVERGGRIERTEVSFPSESALRDAIERILTPLGRRVDELSPMADARLEDGSRVHVVIPPLAVDGPTMSIRRFSAVRPGPRELVELGTLTDELHDQLSAAVEARRSILVSGGTGSGKTTLLNALSAFIDPDERVITIEDAAELRLRQPHVVRLESRPANLEGRGLVTIRELLRGALRMRPDRIVIGEVRGGEALDLLMALNTGHEGALSTVHANSPEDALRRVETLALMAGVGLPHEAIREQLGRGLDLVIHLARLSDGSRRVVEVAEVVRTAGSVGVRELFRLGADGEASWARRA